MSMQFNKICKKLIKISSHNDNFTISILGKNVFTFFNHILMKISKETAICNCDSVLRAKVMTRDVIRECVNSSFDNKYMEYLSDKYGDKFSGIALYQYDELCGYICGLRPDSKEVQYKIKNCEFFVKFVFVYEKFRGQGIASKLFEHLFNTLDINEVLFAVRTNNHSAIKAYKKTGAQEIGRKRFIRILKVNIPYYEV